MARLGRYFLGGQPLHVIQRGNNRQAIFFEAADYGLYRDWLGQAAARYGVGIHAYVLMTNHVHLLATPRESESLPRMMQSLGRRYVRHVNKRYRRSGTLWEGRYRAAPIDSDAYFLTCSRYIELNPVRAGMVSDPADYPWSSHRALAGGAHDPLVAPHPLYVALGGDAAERRSAYLALFRQPLDAEFLDGLRAATNGGWAFGEDRFKREIALAAGRRAEPLPAGRKAKPRDQAGKERMLL
jgi:putative transposase